MMIPLGSRMTIRPLVIMGVVIFSVSSLACYFSTNSYYLMVLFGCLQGCGLVLAYTPLTVLYSIYFKKYRATATGLILTSLQVGSFVFSNLGACILEEYGLRGTFLIMGAISLHGILGAAVLVQHNGKGIRPSSPNSGNYLKNETSVGVVSSQTSLDGKSDLSIGVPSGAVARSKGSVLAFEKDVSSKGHALHCKCRDAYEVDASSEKKMQILCGSLESKDVKHLDFVLAESEQIKVGEKKMKFWRPHLQARITHESTRLESNGKTDTTVFWPNTTGLMSVVTNPYFLLTASSEQVISALLHILSLVIGDYVNDKGIPLEKSFCIFPVFIASDVLARLTLGWVADKNYVSKPSYMAIVSSMLAVPVFTLTFVSGFGSLIFCVAICGAVLGNLSTLSQVLYAEFLPQRIVYIGISMSSSLVGVTGILTPFIIGAFRDNVGSYDNMFRMNAALLIMCSCLWILAAIRWRTRSISTTGHPI